jgi:fructokinase
MTLEPEPGRRVIAIVGEALMDAHPEGDSLRLFPGGGPFNTAVALGRLDAPARFIGALSTDPFGRRLEHTLAAAGVDRDYLFLVDAPTPLAVVDATATEPRYRFYLARTALDALGELPDLPSDVVALHVGTLALAIEPSGSEVAAFAESAAAETTLVLDPNVRPALFPDRGAYLSRFERLAALAGVVKLSTGDLAWLYPGAGEMPVVERLLELGAACVVVTRGHEGADAWTSSVQATASAPRVTVVDTVGAGDAFGAGLLAWLWRADRLDRQQLRRLSEKDLALALAYAAAAGAAQCKRASAWGPTAADVDALLEEEEWQRSSSTA